MENFYEDSTMTNHSILFTIITVIIMALIIGSNVLASAWGESSAAISLKFLAHCIGVVLLWTLFLYQRKIHFFGVMVQRFTYRWWASLGILILISVAICWNKGSEPKGTHHQREIGGQAP